MKVIVLHEEYGCETGCCGHVIEVDGERVGEFDFSHPNDGEDPLEFAKRMVRDELGEQHVADLQWDECIIRDT